MERRDEKCKVALIFAPRENFGLAGKSYSVVTAALNIAEIFVAHVLHARLTNVPARCEARFAPKENFNARKLFGSEPAEFKSTRH
jgi:hypothetical protein